MEIGSIFEVDPHAASKHNEHNEHNEQHRQHRQHNEHNEQHRQHNEQHKQHKKRPQDSYCTKVRLQEVEKYRKRQVRYTASGRAAIALAIRSIVKNNAKVHKRCLLPAYMCDCVFLAFLHEGWELCFYHVNRRLEPDREELRELVAEYEPGVIFTHAYYGVDTWASARHLLRVWQSQGICIMEDVTQSYYLGNVGQDADYVVGSLRKWYPVPDGGFVATNHGLAEEEICQDETFARKKLEVMTQKWDYLNGQGFHPSVKDRFLKKNRELEADMDSCVPLRIDALSDLASEILSHTEEGQCKKRRLANDALLREGIKQTGQICPIFYGSAYASSLPDDTQERAPLYFAVYAQERGRLQTYLSARGIYAPALWPVGKENKDCLHADEDYIYRHLLALPIDQRYGEREMRHIIETVNFWAKEVNAGDG